MIRFLLRLMGLLLLATAFIFVVYDGMRSISDSKLLLTSIQQIWNMVDDRSLQAFQLLVEQYAGADIWRLGTAPILNQPASALVFVLGVLLIVLGRKKKPLIGYARD